MPEILYNSHIDLNKNSLLNASIQVLSTHPDNPKEARFYFNSTDSTPYIWTGKEWLDMGQVYTHPSYTGAVQPASATTGATIISQINLENGHVVGVKTRKITATDIGAADGSHTHNFTEVVGLPAGTILANNLGTTGAAKAITVGDMLTMLSIAYGTAAILATGTDTSQRTWSAKDLTDWVGNKFSAYLTSVNLSKGTHNSTSYTINNSAGTGVTLPSATGALAGLQSGADKTKLDGIETGANKYVHPTQNPGTHPFATELTSGLQVLSQMTVNTEGHVIAIKGRNLTAGDIASVMIVAGTNLTSDNQTWSAKTIDEKLKKVVTDAQTGALIYQAEYNPTTNTPKITTDTTIKVGYTYVVSASGTFAGQEVEAGDMIIAKKDNPGATAANWQIVNKNIPAIVAASEIAAGIVQLANDAETIEGKNATKAVTPKGLKAAFDAYVGGYRKVFGDGSSLSFPIEHGLNTDLVMAYVRKVASKQRVEVDWRASSSSIVTVNLNTPISNGEYEILITKI